MKSPTATSNRLSKQLSKQPWLSSAGHAGRRPGDNRTPQRAWVAGAAHGTEMHQDPQVPNYRTGSRGAELAPGICLAIEPMFTLRSGDVHVERDGWTVSTSDGAMAAHFEHTIAVTDDGPEILTTV